MARHRIGDLHAVFSYLDDKDDDDDDDDNNPIQL